MIQYENIDVLEEIDINDIKRIDIKRMYALSLLVF